MKNHIIASVVLIAGLFGTGCNALPLPFDVTTTSQTVVERGTVIESTVGSLGFTQFTALDFSQSQEFQNRDVQKKHVTGAKIENLVLTVVAPSGHTFDFLENVMFYIEAPGLPKKRIAHKTVPKGVGRFRCEIDEVELGPYVRADTMKITTSVKGRRPDEDTTVEAKLTVNISTVLLKTD